MCSDRGYLPLIVLPVLQCGRDGLGHRLDATAVFHGLSCSGAGLYTLLGWFPYSHAVGLLCRKGSFKAPMAGQKGGKRRKHRERAECEAMLGWSTVSLNLHLLHDSETQCSGTCRRCNLQNICNTAAGPERQTRYLHGHLGWKLDAGLQVLEGRRKKLEVSQRALQESTSQTGPH